MNSAAASAISGSFRAPASLSWDALPLRDPVALRLEGVTIMLRNKEADYITVTKQ